MKPPSVKATDATLTLCEKASLVLNTSLTIQGWRPISVSSQPVVLATNGSNTSGIEPRR
jgi:hypothetical protein